ncbi:UNVERIFIED_CONTAM: hypothetical protein NCL1_49059 [Trichonephila clavipes]
MTILAHFHLDKLALNEFWTSIRRSRLIPEKSSLHGKFFKKKEKLNKDKNQEHAVQEQILPQPLYLLKLCVTQLTFKRFKETNNTNSPTPSVKTFLAVENSKRKRKRVQSKTGEVLSNENVLEMLAAEESDRRTNSI